jgi:hypothetical protein
VDVGDTEPRFEQLLELFGPPELVGLAGDDEVEIELAGMAASLRGPRADGEFGALPMVVVMVVAMVMRAPGAVDMMAFVSVLMIVLVPVVVSAARPMHVLVLMVMLIAVIMAMLMFVIMVMVVTAAGAVDMLAFVR